VADGLVVVGRNGADLRDQFLAIDGLAQLVQRAGVAVAIGIMP